MDRKIAESLVAVHTHTHTVLLNKKINKIDILKQDIFKFRDT